MRIIILTTEQADAVRGPTAPGYALNPVEIYSGEGWFLPARILDAPEHAMHREFLAALPQRELDPATDLPPPEDE